MAITPLHDTLIAAGSTGIAVLMFISAGGYGLPIVRRLWGRTGMAEEENVLAAGIGYGILSLILFAAGVVGVWTRPAAWVILIVGLALSRPFLLGFARFTLQDVFKSDLTTILIFLCALWGFLLALAPITYYDSLVYHLAMPNAYVQAGHWVGLKPLIYSAFPQTMEMLWTFGLLLGNDTVVNMTGFILALLTAAGVACFAARFLDKQAVRPALLLWMAMPAYLLLSSGGYVDMGLTLYGFLSLYALMQWRNTGWRGPLVLSGLFAGLALSTKYTGGIPFAIGAALIVWRSRRTLNQAFVNGLIYGGTALLVFSPWLIKNTFYLGNPVFPFFYQWGNPKLSPWTQGAAQGYFRGVSEYQPRSLLGLLLLPWDIVVHSMTFGGGMDVLGDFGWAPFFLLLPCLFFLRKKMTGSAQWLIAYALLFFIPWGMTRPVLRFLLPLAPVFALLCALGWTDCVRYWSPEYYRSARRVIALFLAYDLLVFFYITGVIGSFPVALGMENRQAYLSRKLNYYAAARVLDRLPHVKKVFVLGDQRGYYYNKPVTVTPVFNENPLVSWANAAGSPKKLQQILKSQGYSHVLINEMEMQRLSPYGIFSFTTMGMMNWAILEKSAGHIVYRDASCEIVAL